MQSCAVLEWGKYIATNRIQIFDIKKYISFKGSYMQKTDYIVIKFSLPTYIVKSFSVICASKVFLNVFVFKRVEFTESTSKSPPIGKQKLCTEC